MLLHRRLKVFYFLYMGKHNVNYEVVRFCTCDNDIIRVVGKFRLPKHKNLSEEEILELKKKLEKLILRAEKYADKHYPGWRKVSTYWDLNQKILERKKIYNLSNR